jgi:hypothetical protein
MARCTVYHLTHGFWSAMQTLGLNNKTWHAPHKEDLLCISYHYLPAVHFRSGLLSAWLWSLIFTKKKN